MDDLKNVECCRCHKKGHFASKCSEAKPKDSKDTFKVRKVEEPVSEKAVEEPKSLRQIIIRFSDLTAEDNDPFIRYWIKVYRKRRFEDGADSGGKDVRVFVDTASNVSIMSKRQFIAFLDANLGPECIDGPFGGLEVKLQVAGDKARIQTEVSTTMGKERGPK